MIFDYYLKLLFEPDENYQIKSFEEWKNTNQKRLESETEESKRNLWQQEEIVGKNKMRIYKSLQNTDKKTTEFYPNAEDLKNLPQNSVLIEISFTLEKPYTSKDEGEFYLLEWQEKKKTEQKIIENPIVRDKFTGLPMVRPSTWKGHLRYAAGKVESDKVKKKKLIKRLFGSEPEEEEALKGRLYFFPTFFTDEAGRDVITPLKRDTRTPARGPITLEVMKPGKNGEFHLLYFPYPRDENFKENEIKEDLEFLAEALKLMFYTYGFSAKKTSGFGVIRKLKSNDVDVHPEDKKGIFLNLIHQSKQNC